MKKKVLFKWLKNNEFILNTINTIALLFVTIIIGFMANSLLNTQNVILQESHKPHFYVSSYISSSRDRHIDVMNSGGQPYIEDIKLYSILSIEYRGLPRDPVKKTFFQIKNYFHPSFDFNGVKNIKTFLGFQNYRIIEGFADKINNTRPDVGRYKAIFNEYIVISYEDIHQNNYKDYFEVGGLFGQKLKSIEGNNIVNDILGYEEITLLDLKKDLESNATSVLLR